MAGSSCCSGSCFWSGRSSESGERIAVLAVGPAPGEQEKVRIIEADPPLWEQAAEIGSQLIRRGETLIVAESVTGGWIGGVLTAIPGSSKWFYGAIVSYQVEAKQRWLRVPADALASCGAVSETVARWMLRGAFDASDADWALATTGYAGPFAGDEETLERVPKRSDPDSSVGLVYIGWGQRGGGAPAEEVQRFGFSGSRESIRNQAVHEALMGLLKRLHG